MPARAVDRASAIDFETTMNQPLGQLARTHTCGALTREDVGKDVVLLGWVHRVRDLGSLVFLDVRDRHGITQVIARDDEALLADAKRLRPEYRRRGPRAASSCARPSRSTRRCRPARSRSPSREIRLLNDAKTPPFPIADDIRRRRRHAAEVSLPRSAPRRACSTTSSLRHRATMEIRQVLRRAGLPRDRDADADEVDAGRGARLSGAEPRASRASSTRCRSRRRSSSRS